MYVLRIKRLILLASGFWLLCMSAMSQGVKGFVKNEDGQPIPFITIYLKETTTGTTTNESGAYEINLKPNSYRMVFQALGYEQREYIIHVQDDYIEHDVVLKKQTIRLSEVKIYPGAEDPAYPIMRKAISLAPYYLRQIDAYASEVYLKGTLDMKKIPRFIAKRMEAEGAEIKAGETYTVESMNKIIFKAPDNYDHTVLSSRSTFPGDEDGSPMGYITNSFYSPTNDITISPLAPNAFSHYKFRYTGFFYHDDLPVNSIEVIPKRKSQQLFKGTIYIVDDLWNLHSVDVVNEAFFGTYHIKQVYAPVKDKAWLPVSYFFNVEASVFGVKAAFNYVGSVKYFNIEVAQNLPVPVVLMEKYAAMETVQFDEEPNVEPVSKTRSQKKMEALLEKEEMSNRDMIKLARLIEKESRAAEEEKESLEVKSTYNFKVEKDTIKRDSVYWSTMRPVPLTASEIKSFEVKDSLRLAKQAEEVDTSSTSKNKSTFKRVINGFLSGKSMYACDSTVRIRYDGLVGFKQVGFNAVDGWSYSQEGSIRYRVDSVQSVYVYPAVRYAFNRERLYWDLASSYSFAPRKRGRFTLSMGQISRDFNESDGVDRTLNMFSALLFKEHYMKLHGDDFVAVSGRLDVVNGLEMNVGLSYHRYSYLSNVTDWSIFNHEKTYASNDPVNPQVEEHHLADQKEALISTSIRYTPKQRYRFYQGRKYLRGSKYPTFTLNYERGVKGRLGSQADFELTSFYIHQEKDWGVFSSFNWKIGGGWFSKNRQMHFSRFRHFNTSEIPVVFKSWDDSFVLLEDYQYSTNQAWLEAHTSYTASYLFLKYLPVLSNRLWVESVYAHYLTQPDFRNYAEIGYAINQIFFMSGVGVFVGFEDGHYNRWGVRLAFHFD
jgi:hypothetical protein